MNELSLFDSLFNNSMDSVLNTYPRYSAVPKVDVTESENAYSLDMELPGRSENDVNIELDRNTLTISSKKEEKSKTNDVSEKGENKESAEKEKFLIRERRICGFSRSFTLPEDVDSEAVSASFKNGILNITMPRKALAQPKKIAITCA